MSALTDKIAEEHETYLRNLAGSTYRAACEGCDWTFEGDHIAAPLACSKHVTEVTEAAVRERVARDIEAQIDDAILYAEDAAFVVAARIARGGAA